MKPKKHSIVGNCTLTLLCAALINHSAQAAFGTWNLDGNSVWNVATDPPWAGTIIADGTGNTADFSTIDITADRTVSLDTVRTIGNLSFGDTNTGTAGGWVLNNNGNPANILTLAGTPVITVNALAAGKEATISAVLTGTSGLTKSGAGTLTLSAANTYTGSTAVNAGILKAGTSTAFGTATDASIAFGPATTGKVQLNNFDMTIIGLNSDTNVGTPIVQNGGANAKTLTINNAVTNTYAGIFQKGAAGNLTITKTGAGFLTLTGSSSTTIGGNITVDGGSLTLSSNGDLSDANGTVGSTALAGSLTVTVTGQGTKWANSGYFRFGQSSTNNSLTLVTAESSPARAPLRSLSATTPEPTTIRSRSRITDPRWDFQTTSRWDVWARAVLSMSKTVPPPAASSSGAAGAAATRRAPPAALSRLTAVDPL